MRHYLLPEGNKQFKANLHSHTTLSDGSKTPEEMKAIYKERGYSILAITDHGKLIDHSALDDEDFIMLTAVEFWVGGGGLKLGNSNIDRAMEFNLFAKDQHNDSLEPFKAMPRTYSHEYMQFVIELAAAIYYPLTDPAAAFKPIAAHIAHVGISSDTDKAWHDIFRCKGIYLTASAVFLNAPIILSSYSQVINLVG